MRRSWLIVILLGCPFLCLGQQPPQAIANPNQQPSAPSQSETQSSTATEEADIHEREAKAQTDAAVQEATSNTRIMWFTGCLVGLAAVQAGIYFFQCQLTREAIDQNRKSSEIQLRAYITISGMKFDYTAAIQEEARDFFGFTLLFRNGGQTPASRLITHVFWDTFSGNDAHIPENYKFPGLETVDPKIMERTGSTSMIGSGETRKSEHGFMPKPNGITFEDAYAKFLKDEVTIFIFARIAYEDAFGEDRVTRGCAKLILEDNSPPSLLGYDMFNDFT